MSHNNIPAHGFKRGLIVGLIAGLGGAFVMYKNRERISTAVWQLRVKANLHRRLNNLKSVTKDTYEQLVDDVMAGYSDLGAISSHKIDMMKDDLKRQWKAVKKDFTDESRSLEDESDD